MYFLFYASAFDDIIKFQNVEFKKKVKNVADTIFKILHQCGERVKTKSQKVLGVNSYILEVTKLHGKNC